MSVMPAAGSEKKSDLRTSILMGASERESACPGDERVMLLAEKRR